MTAHSRPPAPVTPTPLLRGEDPQDAAAIERLVDAAFGPGRYAKAAERLRETNRLLAALSFTAWSGAELAGCVRQWPVGIGGRPAVFLGPIAVDPAWRHHGLGGALTERACAAAREGGPDLILLVGDHSFFGPHGFEVVPPHRIALPGPADPRRTLALSLTPGALDDFAGPVTPGW